MILKTAILIFAPPNLVEPNTPIILFSWTSEFATGTVPFDSWTSEGRCPAWQHAWSSTSWERKKRPPFVFGSFSLNHKNPKCFKQHLNYISLRIIIFGAMALSNESGVISGIPAFLRSFSAASAAANCFGSSPSESLLSSPPDGAKKTNNWLLHVSY